MPANKKARRAAAQTISPPRLHVVKDIELERPRERVVVTPDRTRYGAVMTPAHCAQMVRYNHHAPPLSIEHLCRGGAWLPRWSWWAIGVTLFVGYILAVMR